MNKKIGKILEIKIDLEINKNSYIVKCENKIFLLEEKELNAENWRYKNIKRDITRQKNFF